jgi:hypothetical protein
MSLIHRRAAGVFAAAWVASSACWALPAGWTAAASSSDAKVYRSSSGAMSAELRVYPIQQADGTLADWFESRRTRPMPGMQKSTFSPITDPNANVVFAYGGGVDAQGREVIVVRTGCARSQGGFVLGEAVLSMNLDYFRQTFKEIASILEPACLDNGAAATAKAAPAPAAKPAAEEPAEPPYPYVKAQGTGLKQKDIEAILWRWRNEQSGMTMQVRTYYYLLLKDGTYRQGLPPVALEDFDAAGEKRGAPKEWGRWTRSGATYALQRDGHDVDKLPADSARFPARKDEKLDGTWEIETAYSSLWSVSRSRRAISFDRDGRFSRNSGGSIVGSMGSGGNAVGGSVVHDDDSSSSSMGSAVAVAGTSRKRASTLPDRSGTYRLDGYTLELRYDSGRVERLAFCTTDSRDTLYFNGEELRREKPDKR